MYEHAQHYPDIRLRECNVPKPAKFIERYVRPDISDREQTLWDSIDREIARLGS